MSSYNPDPKRNLRRPARSGTSAPARAESSGGNPISNLIANINAVIDQKRQNAAFDPPKIEPGRRLIALGIDFGVAYVIFLVLSCVPFLNRFLTLSLVIPVVMCLRDYLFGGRGFGKNAMGLRVVDLSTGESPSLMQVLTRNAIYLGPIIFEEFTFNVLHLLPFHDVLVWIKGALGLIVQLYVLVIVPIEIYRSLQREDSMRLGDALAGTCIVEADMNFSSLLPK